MTVVDWRRVIEESAGLGVGMVQFIGGEPTLHPDLLELVDCALAVGVQVEVFSNLVHVTSAMWESFARPGVRLACSYYSDDAGQHAAVTSRAGSHARTRANIAEAVRRSIPLRVGVIDLGGGQRADQAVAELEALGVTEVGYDRLRQVGRGVRDQAASMDQLCGHCARDVLAVAADGAVWPCVFSRWLPVGNVKVTSLAEIVVGTAVREVRDELTAHFTAGGESEMAAECNPDCNPQCNPCHPRCQPGCHPNCNPACQPTCSPTCSPTCQPIECNPRACWPPFSHADEEMTVAPGH